MSFLAALKEEELVLLRRIVRKVHFAHAEVKNIFISEQECDKLIESIGPEVAERMIRFGVDKGLR